MASRNHFEQILIQIAKSFEGSAYLVGGAVRDSIIGFESKDYDYVITKVPLNDLQSKLESLLPESKINSVGKSFGIIKVIFDNEEYDVAIPRADINRDIVKTDHNIYIQNDLSRRDTTINSLAKNLETHEIINPIGYDGISDIKNKIIRSVGNPFDRFNEDALRILRCISQSCRFGFSIEPTTLQGIKDNIHLLKSVSSDRFYDEFYKGWTKGLADTKLFFNLLEETSIGKLMFGDDFKPIPLTNIDLNTHDFFIAQFIAAFINGGNFEVLNKKVEEQEYLRISKWFLSTITNGLNIDSIKEVAKHGDKFDLIVKTFKMIDYSIGSSFSDKTSHILSKPLIPKHSKEQKSYELPLSGGELIELCNSLNKPIKGKQITQLQYDLIKKFQNNEFKNNYIDEIKNHVIIMSL